MAKMLNAPANSEQHEMFLQGLKANLDQAFYKIHSVHPATDAILEPGIALKLANELRGPKPKLFVYPLHKMRTELDTMNGSQKDDGKLVFEDGTFKKKETVHVKIGDLNEVMQRIQVFLTTVGWATNGHHIKIFGLLVRPSGEEFSPKLGVAEIW